ncbi:TIM-barrel domain-containing protein [Chitinophagaceae bacterium LWZ2-11]
MLYVLLYTCCLYAQNKATPDPKVFWKEDFKAGVLPVGWKNVDVSKAGCEWVVTNQPYPGSFEYQQQAPPIASRSRGYHLQYQAGYIVDEDQPTWEKRKRYPDAYMQTAAINCSGKQSVILKFQQTFRWNNYKNADSAGLYVGISTDSIHWTDINVMHKVASATDMFTPINEELNITDLAAGKPKVFIRFYWRGIFSWYWMVDDIELSEAYEHDLGIVGLTSHTEESNEFKKEDVLAIKIKNIGTKDITKDFDVACSIDGKENIKVTVPAGKNKFTAGSEMEVRFPAVDLTKLPTHTLLFTTLYDEDERKDNNSLRIKINAHATPIGNVTAFTSQGNEALVISGVSKMKIIFYRDDIFRVWLAPDGEFTNPAGNDIVINYPADKPVIKTVDAGSYYKLQSKQCVVRVYKTPLRLAMYDASNTKCIWEESKPTVFGARTIQSMERHPDEYFYGCGMQNGYFSHRDKDILIEKGGGWDDGGRANPAPFYMSTAGYGVLRNTFDAGKYSFKAHLTFSHNENRFDAFYFYGPSLKDILGGYTTVTGKPFLMPRWALSMGDANCYNKLDRNKQPQTTPAVINTVADKYIENDMPRGWILPNDGYGCGYTKLDSVVKELAKRGFKTGLWTENGVTKIATEVGQYGTRLCKLDVAWVGPGYKYALDACKAAYEGIENNSKERGFVWSVMGWAGTQRYSTVWSGDQKGNWEYIRFHIPTVTGSGLSAQNAATGDVDGIFGGSDSTYVRDLQWKCFTPVLMVMSGWAKKDKQPYISGEPFSSINRKYLKLKMRLTPYMYTYCNEAYETGVPTSRAMVLEYPKDSTTWGKQTQYQFMNGEWLLVAPVYKSEGKRDSIYLPKGTWFDYWNGDAYTGGKWLSNFNAPLEKLPVFVKAGAIIPMYPQMNYDGEKRADTLTLDLYPAGKTSFNLYEDDGLTREHRQGAFAKTLIEMNAAKNITVTINAARGTYTGKYEKRAYVLQIHTTAPVRVTVNGAPVKKYTSAAEFEKATTGFYYNADDKKGTVEVKTAYLNTAVAQTMQLLY